MIRWPQPRGGAVGWCVTHACDIFDGKIPAKQDQVDSFGQCGLAVQQVPVLTAGEAWVARVLRAPRILKSCGNEMAVAGGPRPVRRRVTITNEEDGQHRVRRALHDLVRLGDLDEGCIGVEVRGDEAEALA